MPSASSRVHREPMHQKVSQAKKTMQTPTYFVIQLSPLVPPLELARESYKTLNFPPHVLDWKNGAHAWWRARIMTPI